MSNFNHVADEVMLAAFNRIGTITGAAKDMKVGVPKVREALKRAGIVAPRGSHMHRVWATMRKGEVSKRRSGPAFVSSHLVHRWNVAFVCMWVNLAKWKFSEDEFREVLVQAAHSILEGRNV